MKGKKGILSSKTRYLRINPDAPSPTIQANGIGDCKWYSYEIDVKQRIKFGKGVGKCFPVPTDEPCPTIQAGGIGGGNTSQYSVEVVPVKNAKQDKPPYSIPTMAEVRAMKKNGYNIVSTFSGCGGSCLGFKMLGFTGLWASEFIPAAQETYELNHPEVILDKRDIRQVRPEEILEAVGKREGEIDVFEGSPPCASFSTAGKREKAWGEVKAYSDSQQRTDDLFFEYIRILRGLKPKVFVAENVSGLVKGTAKGYFFDILKEFKASGYRVQCRMLDAQWLGVPQQRARTIFMGVREDLGIDPRYPTPLPYRYTIRDAIPWIVSVKLGNENHKLTLKDGKKSGWDRGKMVDAGEKPCPTVRAVSGGVGSSEHQVEAEADISKYAIGQEWEKLAQGENSKKYLNLSKPSLEEPSPTVTANGARAGLASVVHPTEKRKFTIEELKRICSFPDDFILTGTYAKQWERLGRSVPPLMMRAVAGCVKEILDEVAAR